MGGLSPPRPLGPEDDRSRFDCRRDALNGWFRQHAWRMNGNVAARHEFALLGDRSVTNQRQEIGLDARIVE